MTSESRFGVNYPDNMTASGRTKKLRRLVEITKYRTLLFKITYSAYKYMRNYDEHETDDTTSANVSQYQWEDISRDINEEQESAINIEDFHKFLESENLVTCLQRCDDRYTIDKKYKDRLIKHALLIKATKLSLKVGASDLIQTDQTLNKQVISDLTKPTLAEYHQVEQSLIRHTNLICKSLSLLKPNNYTDKNPDSINAYFNDTSQPDDLFTEKRSDSSPPDKFIENSNDSRQYVTKRNNMDNSDVYGWSLFEYDVFNQHDGIDTDFINRDANMSQNAVSSRMVSNSKLSPIISEEEVLNNTPVTGYKYSACRPERDLVDVWATQSAHPVMMPKRPSLDLDAKHRVFQNSGRYGERGHIGFVHSADPVIETAPFRKRNEHTQANYSKITHGRKVNGSDIAIPEMRRYGKPWQKRKLSSKRSGMKRDSPPNYSIRKHEDVVDIVKAVFSDENCLASSADEIPNYYTDGYRVAYRRHSKPDKRLHRRRYSDEELSSDYKSRIAYERGEDKNYFNAESDPPDTTNRARGDRNPYIRGYDGVVPSNIKSRTRKNNNFQNYMLDEKYTNKFQNEGIQMGKSRYDYRFPDKGNRAQRYAENQLAAARTSLFIEDLVTDEVNDARLSSQQGNTPAFYEMSPNNKFRVSDKIRHTKSLKETNKKYDRHKLNDCLASSESQTSATSLTEIGKRKKYGRTRLNNFRTGRRSTLSNIQNASAYNQDEATASLGSLDYVSKSGWSSSMNRSRPISNRMTQSGWDLLLNPHDSQIYNYVAVRGWKEGYLPTRQEFVDLKKIAVRKEDAGLDFDRYKYKLDNAFRKYFSDPVQFSKNVKSTQTDKESIRIKLKLIVADLKEDFGCINELQNISAIDSLLNLKRTPTVTVTEEILLFPKCTEEDVRCSYDKYSSDEDSDEMDATGDSDVLTLEAMLKERRKSRRQTLAIPAATSSPLSRKGRLSNIFRKKKPRKKQISVVRTNMNSGIYTQPIEDIQTRRRDNSLFYPLKVDQSRGTSNALNRSDNATQSVGLRSENEKLNLIHCSNEGKLFSKEFAYKTCEYSGKSQFSIKKESRIKSRSQPMMLTSSNLQNPDTQQTTKSSVNSAMFITKLRYKREKRPFPRFVIINRTITKTARQIKGQYDNTETNDRIKLCKNAENKRLSINNEHKTPQYDIFISPKGTLCNTDQSSITSRKGSDISISNDGMKTKNATASTNATLFNDDKCSISCQKASDTSTNISADAICDIDRCVTISESLPQRMFVRNDDAIINHSYCELNKNVSANGNYTMSNLPNKPPSIRNGEIGLSKSSYFFEHQSIPVGKHFRRLMQSNCSHSEMNTTYTGNFPLSSEETLTSTGSSRGRVTINKHATTERCEYGAIPCKSCDQNKLETSEKYDKTKQFVSDAHSKSFSSQSAQSKFDLSQMSMQASKVKIIEQLDATKCVSQMDKHRNETRGISSEQSVISKATNQFDGKKIQCRGILKSSRSKSISSAKSNCSTSSEILRVNSNMEQGTRRVDHSMLAKHKNNVDNKTVQIESNSNTLDLSRSRVNTIMHKSSVSNFEGGDQPTGQLIQSKRGFVKNDRANPSDHEYVREHSNSMSTLSSTSAPQNGSSTYTINTQSISNIDDREKLESIRSTLRESLDKVTHTKPKTNQIFDRMVSLSNSNIKYKNNESVEFCDKFVTSRSREKLKCNAIGKGTISRSVSTQTNMENEENCRQTMNSKNAHRCPFCNAAKEVYIGRKFNRIRTEDIKLTHNKFIVDSSSSNKRNNTSLLRITSDTPSKHITKESKFLENSRISEILKSQQRTSAEDATNTYPRDSQGKHLITNVARPIFLQPPTDQCGINQTMSICNGLRFQQLPVTRYDNSARLFDNGCGSSEDVFPPSMPVVNTFIGYQQMPQITYPNMGFSASNDASNTCQSQYALPPTTTTFTFYPNFPNSFPIGYQHVPNPFPAAYGNQISYPFGVPFVNTNQNANYDTNCDGISKNTNFNMPGYVNYYVTPTTSVAPYKQDHLSDSTYYTNQGGKCVVESTSNVVTYRDGSCYGGPQKHVAISDRVTEINEPVTGPLNMRDDCDARIAQFGYCPIHDIKPMYTQQLTTQPGGSTVVYSSPCCKLSGNANSAQVCRTTTQCTDNMHSDNTMNWTSKNCGICVRNNDSRVTGIGCSPTISCGYNPKVMDATCSLCCSDKRREMSHPAIQTDPTVLLGNARAQANPATTSCNIQSNRMDQRVNACSECRAEQGRPLFACKPTTVPCGTVCITKSTSVCKQTSATQQGVYSSSKVSSQTMCVKVPCCNYDKDISALNCRRQKIVDDISRYNRDRELVIFVANRRDRNASVSDMVRYYESVGEAQPPVTTNSTCVATSQNLTAISNGCHSMVVSSSATRQNTVNNVVQNTACQNMPKSTGVVQHNQVDNTMVVNSCTRIDANVVNNTRDPQLPLACGQLCCQGGKYDYDTVVAINRMQQQLPHLSHLQCATYRPRYREGCVLGNHPKYNVGGETVCMKPVCLVTSHPQQCITACAPAVGRNTYALCGCNNSAEIKTKTPRIKRRRQYSSKNELVTMSTSTSECTIDCISTIEDFVKPIIVKEKPVDFPCESTSSGPTNKANVYCIDN